MTRGEALARHPVGTALPAHVRQSSIARADRPVTHLGTVIAGMAVATAPGLAWATPPLSGGTLAAVLLIVAGGWRLVRDARKARWPW